MACDRCKNVEAFPPFPLLEGLFTMDTQEFGIIVGMDKDGGMDDNVIISIVENESL